LPASAVVVDEAPHEVPIRRPVRAARFGATRATPTPHHEPDHPDNDGDHGDKK